MSAAKLLVTRPREQAANWVERLRAGGMAAQALPLIDIVAVPDPAPLQRAWRRVHEFAFVMFVSANAVDAFFAARPAGAIWPSATRAGATGPGTVAALRQAGLAATLIESPPADAASFDAEALWSEIARRPLAGWQGQRVLVVRGEDGRDWLAERWREHGAQVEFIAAYRRSLPRWGAGDEALCDAALASPRAHLWLFSSSEAIANLGRLRTGADWTASQALATHERIGAAARRLGFARVQGVAPTVAAVVSAVRSLQFDAP